MIERVELRRPDLRFPFSQRFAARLKGRRITALRRRAKYLLAELDDGTVLLMHLGMSGLVPHRERREPRQAVADEPFYQPRGKDAAHDHVVFHLKGGPRIVYNDPRRFGFMLLIQPKELEAHPLLAGARPRADRQRARRPRRWRRALPGAPRR